MIVRKRELPDGWYPRSKKEVINQFSSWTLQEEPERRGLACIVPHAGWFFSGKLAYKTIQRLREDADTVVVIGGHLSGNSNFLCAEEDAYETPLKNLEADLSLKREIENELMFKSDVYADNTVEVLLPMIAWLFPEAEALWLRAPQTLSAGKAGKIILKAAEKLKKKVVIIGSTDLTHYGAGYGFAPYGTGANALSWVKNENDAEIISGFVSMDDNRVIDCAVSKNAACSAGGALVSISYAREKGIKKGKLVDYYTSADIYESDSFVGYAGIVYES